MPFKPAIIFCLVFSFSCNSSTTSADGKLTASLKPVANQSPNNPYPSIGSIPLPEGYSRILAHGKSFAYWLRHIVLKENKTVYLYNGNAKPYQLAQFAVLDISVGNKDLQQCADAVMRLRGEYLFAQKKFDAISFTDNERTTYTFQPPYTKENFIQYMEKVFGMCGTASLSKQLQTVDDISTIQPGDVFIRGGFPGHAVIVTDVAENAAGKKIFMIAQSYMPAQDIHLLVNPMNKNISPWYEVNGDTRITTPEYLFYKTELKRW